MTPTPVLLMTEATAGGTRRHFCDLATGLDRRRFAPTVICSVQRDPSFAREISRFKSLGIPVHIVPMVRDPWQPWRDLTALRAVRRLLTRYPNSILHTHSSKAGFLGRLAARRQGPWGPVIHTPHVFPFSMKAPRPLTLLYTTLEKAAAHWTTQFICVCESEKQAALRRRLAPPECFTVIHNGIAPATSAQPSVSRDTLRKDAGYRPQDMVIGSLGRFAVQKGFETLLRSIRLLAPHYPNLRVLLAGEGPCQPRIEALVRKFDLASIVRLQPPPANSDPFHCLIDIFVLPSLWEGLPYALLEAMAAGKAIVASETGGVPEAIVHDETGLLAPPGRPLALADTLERLVLDPELRLQLGHRAAHAAQSRFQLGAMIAKTEAVYAHCIDKGRG